MNTDEIDRRTRVEANSFEVLIAVLCGISAIAHLLVPNHLNDSPMGEAAAVVRFAWVVLLASAGGFIFSGLWSGKAHLEVAGLIFLSAACAIQAVAVLFVVGSAALTTIVIFAAVAWACLVRARIIIEASRRP